MSDHKLIVFEGGDAAGKSTQAKMAVDYLRKKGKVAYFDFPQYKGTMSGELVGELLHGAYGNFLDLHPKVASMAYALDRLTVREKIKEALWVGDVVCNRYTTSNALYQAAKFKTPAEQDEFIAWLERFEYDEHRMPRSTRVIYLRVPFEVSQKLMDGAGKTKDQYEQSVEYQRTVSKLYDRICSERDDWIKFECFQDDKLLSPDEIHGYVKKFL